MEETVIVVMIKDLTTGFLDKELACYKIKENDNFIYNTYAIENDGKYTIYMKLTCDKDVLDWEFNAIYDYYDYGTFEGLCTSIEEDTDCYNPTWIFSFDYSENISETEEKISQILKKHKEELQSVYEAIADKKDDYENENE